MSKFGRYKYLSIFCFILIPLTLTSCKFDFSISIDNSDISKTLRKDTTKSSFSNSIEVKSYYKGEIKIIGSIAKNSYFAQSLEVPKISNSIFGGYFSRIDYKENSRIRFETPVSSIKPVDNTITLYPKWFKKTDLSKVNHEVTILMYHRFYKEKSQSQDANDFDINLFKKQLKYFKKNNWYFPNWKEMDAYYDKKMVLPKNSVVITSDDYRKSVPKYVNPLVTKMHIPITCFVINSLNKKEGGDKPSIFVQLRSHTYSMHEAGVDGRGKITTYPTKLAIKDLKKSIKFIGGNIQVLAYPYGHYNEHAKQILKKVGFKMAVTVNNRVSKWTDDKLELPRVRMNDGSFWKGYYS